MAISILQTWGGALPFSATTQSGAPSSAVTAGSAIRVFCYAAGGTPTAGAANFTVTSPGLTFSFVGTQISPGGDDCEVYYAANVSAGTPTVTVTATAGQGGSGTTQGVRFSASELGGVSATPFAHASSANNVFVANLNSGAIATTSGNLLVGSSYDNFGETEGTFSSGVTHAGVEDSFFPIWSGDWSVSVGGSISYTSGGGGGFATSFIDEWAAAGSGPTAPPPDVIGTGMNF